MSSETMVNVIRGQVDLRTALENAESMAAGMTVVSERSVLYPYFAFNVRSSVATLAGARAVSLNCLVDGINDVGATADSYATDAVHASRENRLLAPNVAPQDAELTARRTITHGIGRKLRMIAPFNVRLEPAGIVYKRFWILRIGSGRIMMDSVTGHTHPLDASAA